MKQHTKISLQCAENVKKHYEKRFMFLHFFANYSFKLSNISIKPFWSTLLHFYFLDKGIFPRA